MHLAGESIPYRVDGYAMRSSRVVQSQRQAGLDPFVVTSLGFPRTAGVTGVPPVEIIEGTPYHRIDPGADYPAGQASDVLITDTAWLAARVGRQRRPAVIHAGAGPRGFETALVGLALREHLRRPLVYEVPYFPEVVSAGTVSAHDRDQAGQAAPGEPDAPRRATELRCMREADLVITASDAARSAIIAAGVPAAKVAVVPDGAAYGPRYRDIYRDLRHGWPGAAEAARGDDPWPPGAVT
jgi:hypothetical protein